VAGPLLSTSYVPLLLTPVTVAVLPENDVNKLNFRELFLGRVEAAVRVTVVALVKEAVTPVILES
jgi:hypothetical protein